MTAVYAGVALSNIGLGMIVPILPLYAHVYGASSLIIGIMVSALAIGRLVFQTPGGYLADIYRKQVVAALGLLCYVPSLLGMAFLPQPYLFILFRFIEGCAEGIALPALYALVATSVPKEKVGAAFGTFSSVATIGSALGPLFGGALVALLGTQALFVVAAIGPILCALLLFFFSPKSATTPVPEASEKEKPIKLKEILGMLQFRKTLLVLIPVSIFSFAGNFAFSVLQVIFPLYVTDRFHVSEALVGLLFTVNFVLFTLGLVVVGRINDYLRDGKELLFGGLGIGIIFLLLPLAPSYWLFISLFMVEAFVAAWILVGNRRVVGRLIDQQNTGKAFGVLGVCGDAGLLIGPLLTGAVYQANNALPFLLTGGLSLLGTALCLPLLLRTAQPTPLPVEPIEQNAS